ncbi:hypothetical protein C2G38_2155016 [Gigaspora rosea]|uniref:SWIM-type domain-containing protein n=1 Tax=Gigaspora rosea TaxID=44941 RepID=A0A397W499_9GLOM|nr:hypothetical protein C2G38_2155016 [Gigaspora rosea]
MNAPGDNPEHYYQLTLSDNLWLQQDNAGFGTPIAFGVSNKENNYTIRLTVEAVQRNIPCNNNNCNHEYYYRKLANNKGFMRIRECAQLWQPFAMIDKHRPTKRGLQPISRVGRSRSKKEALELGEAYRSFIKSLPLMEITKDSLCNDLYSNWLSEEWINCFIDGGRMPSLNDILGTKPMTTNNLTERMNKLVEGRRVSTQPINSFIERLYGITLIRDNIIEENSSQFVFEAGQGWLYALLHSVRPVEGGSNTYFYVKKGNSGFRLPYTMRKINIDNKSFELLQQMINKLASKHPIMQQNNYYLVNISMGECTCLDFMWNGSFRDVCKHVHAVHLFDDIENNKIMLNSIKHDLVQYFRNKERAMPKEQKNLIIYSNSVDAAFEEILQSYIRGVTKKDPFRPMEMPARRISDVGTPKMHGAKPRKSNGFISDKENYIIDDDPMQLDNEIELLALSETDETLTNNRKEQSGSLAPSIQRRVTATIRNCKRNISKNKLVQNSINVKSTNKDKHDQNSKNFFQKNEPTGRDKKTKEKQMSKLDVSVNES